MSAETEAARLRSFLYPESIAVIGASSVARKAGGRRWLTIIGEGYAGRVYAVTKTAPELNGFKTYGSILDVPEPVDLAIVMAPTPAVPKTVEECARVGVKSVVMITAGFGETGAEGKQVENQMVGVLRNAGARMLGPNSAGVFSAGGSVNCLGWKVPRGKLSLITQSGNMAGTFTQYAKAKSVGFASMIAVGNSADLKLSELVSLLLGDPETKSILIYCEGFAPGDGRRLVDILRTAPRRVPIVMLKPGVSEAGRLAAKSHTGSLAGEDSVVSAALAEAGVIRAVETEEAFDMAVALGSCAPLQGNRIAVLSDGGGHATVVSDCAGRHGLELATLSEQTKAALRRILPDRAAIDNPIDFAGFAESDPDSTGATLDVCIRDPGVDGVIFAGHFGGYHLMTDDAGTQHRIGGLQTAAALQMASAATETGKPFILHSDHAERDLATLQPLRDAATPIYSSLESSAKAMAALWKWSAVQRRWNGEGAWVPASAAEAEPVAGTSPRALTEAEARDRLAAFGVAIPPHRLVASAVESVKASRSFGAAVAMKLMSRKLLHKSDAGGVLLGISAEDEVEAAFDRLADLGRRLEDPAASVLMTPMIAPGVECIIGAKRDAQFGPVVVFGAGGVLAELVREVSIRLAPTSLAEARATIEQSAIAPLLKGYRGTPPVDIDGLARLLSQVSRFIASSAEIMELDLNPVIANEQGAFIADARIVAA